MGWTFKGRSPGDAARPSLAAAAATAEEEEGSADASLWPPSWFAKKGARQTVEEIVALIWLIINLKLNIISSKLSQRLGATFIAAPLSPVCDHLVCIGCMSPW